MNAGPELFAIFHRNFPGDEALLRLFQARFEAAGLGAEIYPADLAEALRTWPFLPRQAPRPMIHLPRNLDVFAAADRQKLLAMASGLAGRARGLVLHDRGDWFARRGELQAVLTELDRQLGERDPTMVFLEYAAGLALDHYAQLIEAAQPLSHVSACLDTGHVTVFTARAVLHRLAPGVNPDEPATLQDVPRDRLAPAVQAAETQALAALIILARRLSRLGKPLHVHLHEGHLFARWSPFPVSDHAPFGWKAGPDRGGPLLGESGVASLLQALRLDEAPGRTSITLEIHPSRHRDRQPLGSFAPLFSHWRDLSHAEMTNAWIELLLAQHALVRRIAEQVRARRG